MKYVVIDVETTGLDCHTDAVIEIAAVKVVNWVVSEEFSTLVNPGRQVPEEISNLTGITAEMLCGQPRLPEIIPQLEHFLEDAVPAGHNAEFDRGFLQAYLGRDDTWLDTMELAKIILPCEPSYALVNLAYSLGIAHPYAHRALGDAKAAADLLILLLDRLEQADYRALEALYRLCQQQKGPLTQIITKNFSQRTRYFSQEKLGSRRLYKVPNEDIKGFFATHAPNTQNPHYILPLDEIKSIFASSGLLNSKMDVYEHRPQQEEMAAAVSRAFNNGQHLVVEAGTGTGKSLAYLVPAVLWSMKSGQKVVVSTHTLNLQEQLLTKDIPLLKRVLGWEFQAAVIKGRGHYLCLRKWETGLEQGSQEIKRFLMRLVLWLEKSQTGDCNEMSLSRKETGEWQQVAAHSETCWGTKCRFFRGLCFIARARRLAEASHLLIANHSLLLANATMDDSILPDFKYLVVDEAHHLEKVAEEQFGTQISYAGLISLFVRLKKRGNTGPHGILDSLHIRLAKWTLLDEEIRSKLDGMLTDTLALVDSCSRCAEQFFSLAGSVLMLETTRGTVNIRTVRIMPVHRDQEGWAHLSTAGDNLAVNLWELIRLLGLTGELLSAIETRYGWEIPEINEMNVLTVSLHQVIASLQAAMSGEDENHVIWVEFTGENPFPVFKTAPVEVKEHLAEGLFASKSAVVLTSATLTVNGHFEFFIDNVGLGLVETPVVTISLPSPFNYQENVLLGLVDDLPDPARTPEFVFVEAVCHALVKLINASQGRSLVLFTSHQQLKQVYEKIKLPLQQDGIKVYAHGLTGSRARLLESFKNDKNSVILGANSFWEGVDVVGSTLSSVIIVKLPFWPPTLPIVSARLDRYRDLKLDGFSHYSLPQAIIRFKQGFGRLIRSQTDTGVVCVLDRRVYEKRYGKSFIRSLPPVQVTVCHTEELAKTIDVWLKTKDNNK